MLDAGKQRDAGVGVRLYLQYSDISDIRIKTVVVCADLFQQIRFPHKPLRDLFLLSSPTTTCSPIPALLCFYFKLVYALLCICPRHVLCHLCSRHAPPPPNVFHATSSHPEAQGHCLPSTSLNIEDDMLVPRLLQ